MMPVGGCVDIGEKFVTLLVGLFIVKVLTVGQWRGHR